MLMPPKKTRRPILTSEPQRYTLLRVMIVIASITITTISLGTIIFYFIFVYQRAADTDVITRSRAQGTLHLIDFEHLAGIESKWTLKHSSSTLPMPRDPFYGSTAAPAPAAANKKSGGTVNAL